MCKVFKFSKVLLYALAAFSGGASADSDLIYDTAGGGYDVCGYGKIVSLGLATDSNNMDLLAVELEHLPNSGQYLAFRGKSVIGMKKLGDDHGSRQLFSLTISFLAQAMASGSPVRILHLPGDNNALGKCNSTVYEFDIRACAAGLPCWRPDPEL